MVFRFSQVAALAQSFQPVLDLSALWEGRWIGIPSQDSITQRTGLPAWATGLLMAGILPVMGVGFFGCKRNNLLKSQTYLLFEVEYNENRKPWKNENKR